MATRHVPDDGDPRHAPRLEPKLESGGRNVNVVVGREDAAGLDLIIDDESRVEIPAG
jgi:hypothetical protein